MTLIKKESIQGFQNLPAVRQVGLMIGLSASIALGIAIVMWSQTPNYSLLFGKLGAKDAGNVLESLQKANIRYKLDSASGAILVPHSDLHKAKMHLAKDDLPKSGGMGFEFLKNEESFRTSNATRYRRYIHAQEIELARTIASIKAVESARVHLAVSNKSRYIGRKSEPPKATIFLKMYGGNSLGYGQVKAIIHIVSSSITGLSSNHISVVDQNGKLLTRATLNSDQEMSDRNLDYKGRVEYGLIQKIEDIITPLVGEGRVRAKVNVSLDLTRSEQTRETYNPDYAAVAKEEVIERRSGSSGAPSGEPGAKANSPGQAGSVNKQNVSNIQANTGSSSRIVRKRLLPDKTISHTKKASGTIRRLSIAVLVDDKHSVDDEGEVIKTPLTKAEITQIVDLIKGAVGFDATRGDVINVRNATFFTPPPVEELPELSLLEEPWLWDIVKQVLGGIAVLILIFAVLKPVLKSLANKSLQTPQLAQAVNGDVEQGAVPQAEPTKQLIAPDQDYEERLNYARNMVGQDPGRVAQVVKNWVSTDG